MSLNLGFIVFVVSEPLPLAYCSINLPTVLLPAGDPAVVLDGLAGVLVSWVLRWMNYMECWRIKRYVGWC